MKQINKKREVPVRRIFTSHTSYLTPHTLLMLFLTFTLFQCIEDEGDDLDQAVVNTSTPDKITGTTARFIGHISDLGDYEVSDHGFVWSTSPRPTLASEGKVSLGYASARGEFTSEISGLEEGKTYYIRAYITDEMGIVYDGDAEEEGEKDYDGIVFSTLSLAAFSFEPGSAKVGEQVVIKGNNFSLIPGNNTVEFGSVRATIDAVTAKTLTVRVPQDLKQREVKIYVTVGGKTAVSYDEFNLISGAWSKVADFSGGKRKFASSFSIGGKIYYLLGQDGDNQWKTDLWEYDPSLDQWNEKAAFPGQGRSGAVTFVIGNKGYVGTGENETKLKDFWEYDAETNSWAQKANLALTSRAGAVGFSSGGKGYIGLGNDGNLKKDLWQYNPVNNTWTEVANFPGTARYGSTAFVINEIAYVGTGLDGSGLLGDFYSYDPNTNQWTKKANFPGAARYMATGFSLHNKGFLGTGFSTKEQSDFWEYSPAQDKWYSTISFGGTARFGSTAVVINDKAYVGSGKSATNVESDFWQFKDE